MVAYDHIISLASFGALIHGPVGHYFYGYLDSVFPGNDTATVALKVFIDQVSDMSWTKRALGAFSCFGVLAQQFTWDGAILVVIGVVGAYLHRHLLCLERAFCWPQRPISDQQGQEGPGGGCYCQLESK